MKINGRLILFTLLLVVLATACKFFFGPDLAWSGFSPVIAIALFSGMIMKQKDMSFLLPLLALLLSDAVIQLLYEPMHFLMQVFIVANGKIMPYCYYCHIDRMDIKGKKL